jgi:uncharacterized radical SAM superfamily Fe-S cluster-containing enzyme
MPTPNKLLDHVLDITKIKNDAKLSRALDIAPPVLSRVRHGTMKVGASLILKIHELTGMPIKEIKKNGWCGMSDNLFLGDTTYPHLPDVELLQAHIAELEQELAEARKDTEKLYEIKQQFINYENADAYALDMMIEYDRLQTLIMSIKETE